MALTRIITTSVFTIWRASSRSLISTIVKDIVVRFAIGLLRDRIAKDLASIGYTKDDKHVWRVQREKILPFDPDVSATVHEADAIRSLVETALVKLYPLREPPKIEVGESCIDRKTLKAMAKLATS